MKHSVVILLLSVMAISLATGCRCGTDRYSGRFYDIDPAGWAYGDVLTFEPAPADTLGRGTLTLAVRHTNDYLYSNLYVEVTVDGRADTFNVPLANEYGRWYGRGIGTDFQVAQTLYRDISLPRGTQVAVRHIMRVDTLPDIEQIGLSFTIDK